MVEIFKTDVQTREQASILIKLLYYQVPTGEINFDLEDCDRILRIKGGCFRYRNIIQTMKANGYECVRLK